MLSLKRAWRVIDGSTLDRQMKSFYQKLGYLPETDIITTKVRSDRAQDWLPLVGPINCRRGRNRR